MERTKTQKKSKRAVKKKNHFHIWDMPASYFPKGKSGKKAKEYAKEVARTGSDLRYTNRLLQYSGQICSFNIKSIYQKSVWGYPPREVFDKIQEFVYHYENYCQRVYVHREKLLQFINAVIPIGYTEKEVRIRLILINPLVKQAGIALLLEKFSKKNTPLWKIYNSRTRLTHRLFYGVEFDHYFRPKMEKEWKKQEDFRKWCEAWRKQIMHHAKLAERCTQQVSEIDNQIVEKIMSYKNSLK